MHAALLAALLLSLPQAAPEAKSVLVVGDSHATTTFGRALDLLLRTLPDIEVTTVGSCGVSPDAFLEGLSSQCGLLQIEAGEPDWVVVKRRVAKTPRLDELLSRARPSLTIVELGANQIHTAWRDPEGAARDIAAMADAIRDSGSDCLWVGPPAGRDDVKPREKIDHLYGVLARALAGRCTLLDSRPASLPFLDYERLAPSAGDGRHWDAIGILGQQAARRWALEVFRVAESRLHGRASRDVEAEALVVVPASTSAPARGLDLRFRHQLETVEGGARTVALDDGALSPSSLTARSPEGPLSPATAGEGPHLVAAGAQP